MHIGYHKWLSTHLGQEMELKVYGHAGKPMLVFPTPLAQRSPYHPGVAMRSRISAWYDREESSWSLPAANCWRHHMWESGRWASSQERSCFSAR